MLVKDPETAELLYDLSDDLSSISTNKAYGRCSGTWQIMLRYRGKEWKESNTNSALKFEWNEILQPNMMVTIEMDAGNGAGFFPVMCGLIDRVSVVRQGGLVPQRSVKVSGRDMGKLLETHDVAYDIIAYNKEVQKLAAQDGTTQPLTRVSREWDRIATAGSPGDIITAVYGATMGELTTTKRMLFRDHAQDTWQVFQPNMASAQGIPFWSYIKQVERAPMNIICSDTNRKNVDWFEFWIQKQPIDDETGMLRPLNDEWHTIGEPEITDGDLGVSDGERINLVSYQPAIHSQGHVFSYDVSMAHPDLTKWDEEDVKKNGLHPKVFTDSFTPPEMQALYDADQGNVIKAINTAKGVASALWNWFKNIHTYETGTLTIHLRPDIRIGSGLLVKQRDSDEYKEYLIEQVIHQCVFGERPAFTTTLHLTRGQKASPRATDKAGPPKPVSDATPPERTNG